MRLFLLILSLLILLLAPGCMLEKPSSAPALQQQEGNGASQAQPMKNSSINTGSAESAAANASSTGPNSTNATNTAQVPPASDGNWTLDYLPTLSKEGEMCGGAAVFLCENGLECVLQGNATDAGGICKKPGWDKAPEFHACPLKRNGICLPEFRPVCGRSREAMGSTYYMDYSNPCLACSQSSNAIGYFEGRCAKSGH